jgi:Histidine kinase-, DNA gyrase B-, and HSP90-like ATPase
VCREKKHQRSISSQNNGVDPSNEAAFLPLIRVDTVSLTSLAMALRAFHANPSIGGFGGESTPLLLLRDPPGTRNRSSGNPSTSQPPLHPPHPRPVHRGRDGGGDALCQIVKELVDNAVDACSSTEKNKRIRVEIKPYKTDVIAAENEDRSNEDDAAAGDDDDDDDDGDEILQVLVSDNGSGMENIRECVNAFHSSKGIAGNDRGAAIEADRQTNGRYGIGLTLCLLHAQRLIPNSYACITSTVAGSNDRTRALFVVDTAGDTVECRHEERIAKRDPRESGTCVSLLVPVSPGRR